MSDTTPPPPHPPHPPESPLHADLRFLRQLDQAATELLVDGGARPRWAVEVDAAPAVRAVRRMNQAMVEVARLSTPEESADVADHCSRIQAQLALPRGRAEIFCDLGILCRRMPLLSDHLDGGMLGYDHLRVLTRATDGVDHSDAGLVSAVEEALVAALTPRRHGQAVPGPRSLFRRLATAVGEVDKLARPIDPDAPATDPSLRDQRRVSVDTYDPAATTIAATLHPAEADEFLTILDAVCQDRDCSRADGLMHLARGSATVSVTLNLYREIDSPSVTTAAGHWLDDFATARFMQQVTHLRVPGHDRVENYVPTEQIRAFVRGRDGSCRFPGCDVPADDCDIDHVRRYDHAAPAAGGPTDTRNLQCLCRRHHLLKTMGRWDPTIAADATVMWTSIDDGHSHLTEPVGPLARFARTTFADRASRRFAVVRRHNTARLPDTGDPEVPF
ncbi:HNH endonuclease signature motif containing protein [Corynebacterium sp. USCH3]|uniref:HNH endonuclease signature motif containing protein n=1 Tax=Corynebacterium sp. USCH3 TaxID=3024840 RepID=UPI0030B0509D